MARLIEADVLSDLLDVEYKRKMKLVRKGEKHLDTLAEGIMSMSVLLGTMPTVDAVPVVRCKKCKYGEPMVGSWDNKVWCGYHKCFCPEDGFCSYGERRTDG